MAKTSKKQRENNIILQEIVKKITPSDVSKYYNVIDIDQFSQQKKLFYYQRIAIENAIKALYLFYERDNGDKEKFFERFNLGGERIKKTNKNVIKLLKEFDFEITDEKLPLSQVINRMNFWMATGSGKTLIVIKIIELLDKLMRNGLIQKKDIMFLTHKDELLHQFKKHVEEFNQSKIPNEKINLHSLKDYGTIASVSSQGINIYYYRSDLLIDERKERKEKKGEKKVDFRSYDNNGNWYLILDEAHKGEKEDSIRQSIYTILSRNGFMFNFSATFAEKEDYYSVVYKFNLEEFIKDGFGKHIFVSKQDISNLGKKDASLEYEKQKILLKIFVLLSAINKHYEKIKQIDQKLYHKPLLITLVDSINTEDSDLELFFMEISKIANGNLDKNLLEIAKDELIKEINDENSKLEFENIYLPDKEILTENIKPITGKDILYQVFNAQSFGKIEAIKIPYNDKELVFKLTTSDRPFALMKIGDNSEWIKEKLYNHGIEIIETFDNESVFKNLDQDQDINILMGSRSFFEGWDTNRPNVILFINIGTGIDAKKFVLQSIGRGVRIQPLPNKRGRLSSLKEEVNKELYQKIHKYVTPLETLFIYGTRADNLQEIINILKQESMDEESIGHLFEINPELLDKLLLIPTYKDSNLMLIEKEDRISEYAISEQDRDMIEAYLKGLDGRILAWKYDADPKIIEKLKATTAKIIKNPDILHGRILAWKYDADPKIIEKLKATFEQMKDITIFHIDKTAKIIKKPDILLQNIISYFSAKLKEFDGFKELDKDSDIVHFRHITITKNKLNSIKEKIENIKEYKKHRQVLIEKARQEGLDDSILKKIIKNEEELDDLTIKDLEKHYYMPVIISKRDTIDYIKHIIKVSSEYEFLQDLKDNKDVFKGYDWWYFSKLDETLDKICIPYYDKDLRKIREFKPDFIFWLKKDNKYTILFIDPHSANFLKEATKKINGYKEIFEDENGDPRIFNKYDLEIKVIFRFFNKEGNTIEGYHKYFISTIKDLESVLDDTQKS